MFLGNPSARVRDELWKQALEKTRDDSAVLQIWSDKNPQGFTCRQHGNRERTFQDFEGMSLVTIRRTVKKASPQNVDTTNG